MRAAGLRVWLRDGSNRSGSIGFRKAGCERAAGAPEHEWNRLLDEYEKSGLTQKAFARREGLNVHTLVAWIGRRRKKSVAARQPNKPVRFRELSLSPAAASPLEVHLPDGLVLKGGSPRDLATLVRALGR